MVKSDRFQSVGISKNTRMVIRDIRRYENSKKAQSIWTVYGFAVVVCYCFLVAES